MEKPIDRNKPWRDYLENILIAVFIALLVRGFVLTGYRVPTSSMAPTLVPGDFIFAFRVPYGIKIPTMKQKIAGRMPERGEVVVFTYPEQPQVNYVKRVVGLPGDIVQIQNGILQINGDTSLVEAVADTDANTGTDGDLPANQAATESENSSVSRFTESNKYSRHQIYRSREGKSQSFGPLVIPPGEVFLLGDNRDASDDSRYWGTVPVDKVEGRVVLIWLSLDWSKSKIPSLRWNRIFTSL